METIAEPERRFGPEFVAQHTLRLGQRPPEQRQLTYDQAVDEQYAPWRDWLDEQLAYLSAHQADALAGKVWKDEFFWTTIFELAVGAELRRRGLRLAYEAEFDGLTPDWTVLDEAGDPAMFVEVHTDMPARETFARMRAWHGLVQRIRKIPAPVVLTLAPTAVELDPPDAGTAKKISKDLQRQLLSLIQPAAPVYRSCGYTFLLQGDPRTRQAMASPFGMFACFEPPSCMAGYVTADRLLVNVGKKVAKYRDLAAARRVPLVVAVGAHRFTGVTLETLDVALQGCESPGFTLQFNLGDTYLGGEQTVQLGPVAPWPMPAELAGLMWVATDYPFQAVIRPNPLAARPVPAALLD
jgi:hypothetical protein